jgi:DNA-binding IclR family transcriptional regulator
MTSEGIFHWRADSRSGTMFHMKERHSSMRNGRKDGRLSSVATALLLLKCFSDEQYELGIAGLAVRLGLAKSTVHRLTSTLVEAGMLEQNKENSKYRLGLTIFELGSLVRRNMDVYNEAKVFLRELREQTGESVNLAILRDDSVVYLNSLESPSSIKVTSSLGVRMPVHCSAEGKVLLAFGGPEDADRIIAAGLPGRTPQTIVDPDSLHAELSLIREKQYAIDNEEHETGARSIAAPVFGGDNEVVAAVGVAGPVQRLSNRTLISFLPSLSAAVEGISRRLGGTRPAPVSAMRIVKS